MPVYNQAQTAMLGAPTPPPAPTGQLGASPNSYNPWQTYDNPNTGQVGLDAADAAGNAEGVGDVSAMDLNRVAANVGGITTDSIGADEEHGWKTFVPEAADPVEEEINEFEDAYSEGYTKETKGDIWSGGWSAEGTEKGAGTMAAARTAKRDDRKQDRENRQEMRKDMWDDKKAEYEAQGMSEGKANRKARRDSRRAKRAVRKGQHAQRKESWDTFKGGVALEAAEDAYDAEARYQ